MSIQQFRKKPVIIEAMQIDTLDYNGLCAILKWSGARAIGDIEAEDGPVLAIDTLEGTMEACDRDWIIKGVAGEFYPCKPDIFAASYEPVS